MSEDNRDKQENQPEAAAMDDIAALQDALAAEKAASERYLAGWQRAQADFINYKKYTEQERLENIKFANASLIRDLLPILDDFERAFRILPPQQPANSGWLEGIRLIHRKLWALLESRQLSEIQTLGEPFDPALHEAAMQVEGEEGIVIEELQKGYRLQGRMLRPARVAIGKGIPGNREDK